MAIYYAISLAFSTAMKNQDTLVTEISLVSILSDSMSALQAIANTQNWSGQQIIQAITQSARELKMRGIPLHL
jgi:type II secretory pathway component PulM